MSDFFRLQKRIDELSKIGGRDTSVTRLGLTAEEQAARHLVGSWCEARTGFPVFRKERARTCDSR